MGGLGLGHAWKICWGCAEEVCTIVQPSMIQVRVVVCLYRTRSIPTGAAVLHLQVVGIVRRVGMLTM